MYSKDQILQKNSWWSEDAIKKRIAKREDLDTWECHEDNGIFEIHFTVTETKTGFRGTSLTPVTYQYKEKIWDIRGYFSKETGQKIDKKDVDRAKDHYKKNKFDIKRALDQLNLLLDEDSSQFNPDKSKNKINEIKSNYSKIMNSTNKKIFESLKTKQNIIEEKMANQWKKLEEKQKILEQQSKQLDTNEAARKNAETARENSEAARKNAEIVRQNQEAERKAAEAARQAEETARQNQEAERRTTEEARKAAEAARQAEETARLKLNKQFEQTLELIKSESHYKVVTIDGAIKVLSKRKELIKRKLEKTLESIESESHKGVLKVKNANFKGISKDEHTSQSSEYEKHYNEYKKLRDNDSPSALKQLEQAIKLAIKLAPNYYETKEYNFEKDKFGDGDTLGIKDMLKKFYALDAKIKQSDLDFKIKKHLEEIKLQNQTLELKVSEINQDQQIENKKHLFQSGFKFYKEAWEIEIQSKQNHKRLSELLAKEEDEDSEALTEIEKREKGALDSKINNSSHEVKDKIKLAKDCFDNAMKIPVIISEDCKLYYTFCILKLEGNKIFEEGMLKFAEALELADTKEQDNFEKIKSKTLDLLNSASHKFSEGLQLGEERFRDCLEFVDHFTEQVENLRQDSYEYSEDDKDNNYLFADCNGELPQHSQTDTIDIDVSGEHICPEQTIFSIIKLN